MNEKEAELFLENHVDQEDLLDFDPFLVGGGNTEKFNEYLRGGRRRFQLSGVSDISDLVDNSSKELDLVNDFPDMVGDILSYEGNYSLFLTDKSVLYHRMGFTVVKSRMHKGPITEANLILSDVDKYLIQYLTDNVYSTSSVSNLAQLSAWSDMGITKVRIEKTCDCPMCCCVDGSIMGVTKLSELISARSSIYSCKYNLTPVITDRKSVRFKTTDDIMAGLSVVSGAPIEFLDRIVELCSDCEITDIEFLDCRELPEWDGTPVIFSGSYLIVHNGYLHNKSPLDFINEWFNPLIFESSNESSSDIYYVNGVKSRLENGVYISISNGKVL